MPLRWMPRAGLALLTAACLTGCLTGCSPALDWREVRPEGSGVFALFPCKPARHARQLTLVGAPVRLTLLACTAGGVTWAMAYADVSDPARVGPALGELLASARLNVAARSETPVDWRASGATPNPESRRLALEGSTPDGKPVHEQVAVFAKGTWVFQATVLGERIDAEALEAFFGALRLLP